MNDPVSRRSPGRTFLKWGLIAVGAVVALALIAALIGVFLPEAHTATVSREVPAPRDSVWAVMTTAERFPDWRAGVDAVAPQPDTDAGLPVWRESGPTGAMTIEITEWDPPRRMVTRIADDDLPFGGTWTYALEPAAGGTLVTITEDGEVYNPFFRFVSRFIMGHDATMQAYLESLDAHLRGTAE